MTTPTTSGKPRVVSHGLRVGSKVWIASVWNRSKPPVKVTVTRIWKGQGSRNRLFHFTPKAFGETFFGWNGMCFGKYSSAYRTREEALQAR